MYIYIFITCIYIYIYIYTSQPSEVQPPSAADAAWYLSYGRFPKFHRVSVGPRPWHIEIRHRVKKTSTINLCGFETLKLKIRRLKLWKPTVGWSNNTSNNLHFNIST